MKKKKKGGILTYEAKMMLTVVALIAMWGWVFWRMLEVVWAA